MHPRLARLASRGRVLIARRPWIRWSVVAGLSAGTALTVVSQLDRIDAERATWSERRLVLVAAADHSPGDLLQTEFIELPVAAIPPTALTDAPADATVRQRVSSGEVVVDADLARGPGPAAAADDGTAVVAIADPLVRTAPIGAPVSVFAEGLVLAEYATVVHVDADVLFVAVDPADAPIVAAAAQNRTASIAFTR